MLHMSTKMYVFVVVSALAAGCSDDDSGLNFQDDDSSESPPGAQQGSGGSAGSLGGSAPSDSPCWKTIAGSQGVIPVCCDPQGTEKDMVSRALELLNAHRMSNGKSPLMRDDKLEAAMQGHVRHMVSRGFFSHTAPEPAVAAFSARARLCGTSAGGENIASGQRSPEEVMMSWKNSSGHNANMLGNFTRIGIGFHQGRWGQIFAR